MSPRGRIRLRAFDGYTTGDLAQKFGVSRAAVRVWERLGRIPPARRWGRTKTRYWTEEDVQIIRSRVRT